MTDARASWYEFAGGDRDRAESRSPCKVRRLDLGLSHARDLAVLSVLDKSSTLHRGPTLIGVVVLNGSCRPGSSDPAERRRPPRTSPGRSRNSYRHWWCRTIGVTSRHAWFDDDRPWCRCSYAGTDRVRRPDPDCLVFVQDIETRRWRAESQSMNAGRSSTSRPRATSIVRSRGWTNSSRRTSRNTFTARRS